MTVSPAGSSKEDGEWKSDSGSWKRRLDPKSTAARVPHPQPLPENSGKRFQGQRDEVRYARPENWRRVAMELSDRTQLAEKSCDLNDMRAEHFEVKSIELEKQVDEARQKIQLLENQLRESQTSASDWKLKAEQTEQQLQQASRENKEFESQLTIKEQALIDKTDSEQKLKARAAELIMQRDQANQTAGMLKTKLNQLQNEYEVSKKATDEKVSRLQDYQEQQRTSSEKTMTALRKEKAQLSGTAKARQTTIEELRVKCQSAIEGKTAAENKLAVIQQRLEETQNKLAEEEKTVSGLQHALAMIRAQIDAKLVKKERRDT